MIVDVEEMRQRKAVPWYYGVSYRLWDLDRLVFHVVPLNLLIRFWHWSKCQYFYLMRMKPTFLDQQIQKALDAQREKMYKNFNNVVRQEVFKILKNIRNDSIEFRWVDGRIILVETDRRY